MHKKKHMKKKNDVLDVVHCWCCSVAELDTEIRRTDQAVETGVRDSSVSHTDVQNDRTTETERLRRRELTPPDPEHRLTSLASLDFRSSSLSCFTSSSSKVSLKLE